LDTGFRLGGGEVFSVRSKDQLFETFRRLIADEKVGLIGIQEDFFSEIKRSFAKELKEGWPLVISFPSEIFEGKKRDHVAELIKEAIGYYVKLR
jgi:vacuolar-type H+-ATPase subunit F/Vma7